MQFFFLHLLSISVQYLWKSDFAFTITDKTKSRLVRDVNLHDVYNLRTFDDTWLYAFLQLFKNACIKKLMHQKVVWNLLSDKFLLIYLLWIMLSLFILNFRRLLYFVMDRNDWYMEAARTVSPLTLFFRCSKIWSVRYDFYSSNFCENEFFDVCLIFALRISQAINANIVKLLVV